jgi:hypothetical protein
MYTLDNLIQDAAAKRAKVEKGDSMDYSEVWGAYLRYLNACLEQKRGLQLSSFCRIGWQVEKRAVQAPGGKLRYTPFFQVTEQFARSNCPNEVAKLKAPMGDRELVPFEEFNFSKAAIKHSGSLTKDQVFTGLRSLVQQLGVAVGEGQDIDIDFGSIGRLLVREKEPRFSFSGAMLAGGGEAGDATNPEPMTAAPRGPTASAFRKDAPEEAMGLGIQGGAPNRQPMPTLEEQQMPALQLDQGQFDGAGYGDGGYGPPSRRSDEMSGIGSQFADTAGRRTPMLTSQQFKREVAYKEAMDRHISEMENRASEAVNEKDAFHSHVNDCLSQERDEMQIKRQRAQQNQYFLRQQVQWREKQKKEQRKDDIVAASAHDFPTFTEPAAAEMKEFMNGQQARMRADLDEQVQTNNTLRNLQKRRERALEVDQLQANRMEMGMLREAERAKKAYDKEALATAWNSEIRMKNIWKAIESHNKVGSQAGSHAPQVLNINDVPPSRGGSSTVSAGRLMTGSSRRVPLGASSSMPRLQTGSQRC